MRTSSRTCRHTDSCTQAAMPGSHETPLLSHVRQLAFPALLHTSLPKTLLPACCTTSRPGVLPRPFRLRLRVHHRRTACTRTGCLPQKRFAVRGPFVTNENVAHVRGFDVWARTRCMKRPGVVTDDFSPILPHPTSNPPSHRCAERAAQIPPAAPSCKAERRVCVAFVRDSCHHERHDAKPRNFPVANLSETQKPQTDALAETNVTLSACTSRAAAESNALDSNRRNPPFFSASGGALCIRTSEATRRRLRRPLLRTGTTQHHSRRDVLAELMGGNGLRARSKSSSTLESRRRAPGRRWGGAARRFPPSHLTSSCVYFAVATISLLRASDRERQHGDGIARSASQWKRGVALH